MKIVPRTTSIEPLHNIFLNRRNVLDAVTTIE